MNDRKAELKKLCENLDDDTKKVTTRLVDEIVFLEERLTELKRYPFIAINPKNEAQQRPTAASKQYKELLQQYNNCIKIMLGALGSVESAEESPLRQYLKRMQQG